MSAVKTDQTVLLVDDHDLVRRTTCAILTSAGYRVTTAANGPEAISIAERSPGFDLLLTDLMMPGMNGRELLQKLRERWPGLPVLMVSGMGESLKECPELFDSTFIFLPKPFQINELLEAVRTLIGRQKPVPTSTGCSCS